MTKIIKNTKYSRGPAPYRRRKSFGSGFPGSETLRRFDKSRSILRVSQSSTTGFVILFAVTISAIILSIALGVANIAFKEIKFGTSDKDTNAAFFAADTGADCALFYDKTTENKFPAGGPATPITCANANIPVNFNTGVYNFTITNLGDLGQGCAKVTVDKTALLTKIISNGYNNGGGSCVQSSNTVERQIELNY